MEKLLLGFRVDMVVRRYFKSDNTQKCSKSRRNSYMLLLTPCNWVSGVKLNVVTFILSMNWVHPVLMKNKVINKIN